MATTASICVTTLFLWPAAVMIAKQRPLLRAGVAEEDTHHRVSPPSDVRLLPLHLLAARTCALQSCQLLAAEEFGMMTQTYAVAAFIACVCQARCASPSKAH